MKKKITIALILVLMLILLIGSKSFAAQTVSYKDLKVGDILYYEDSLTIIGVEGKTISVGFYNGNYGKGGTGAVTLDDSDEPYINWEITNIEEKPTIIDIYVDRKATKISYLDMHEGDIINFSEPTQIWGHEAGVGNIQVNFRKIKDYDKGIMDSTQVGAVVGAGAYITIEENKYFDKDWEIININEKDGNITIDLCESPRYDIDSSKLGTSTIISKNDVIKVRRGTTLYFEDSENWRKVLADYYFQEYICCRITPANLDKVSAGTNVVPDADYWRVSKIETSKSEETGDVFTTIHFVPANNYKIIEKVEVTMPEFVVGEKQPDAKKFSVKINNEEMLEILSVEYYKYSDTKDIYEQLNENEIFQENIQYRISVCYKRSVEYVNSKDIKITVNGKEINANDIEQFNQGSAGEIGYDYDFVSTTFTLKGKNENTSFVRRIINFIKNIIAKLVNGIKGIFK